MRIAGQLSPVVQKNVVVYHSGDLRAFFTDDLTLSGSNELCSTESTHDQDIQSNQIENCFR